MMERIDEIIMAANNESGASHCAKIIIETRKKG